MPVVQVLGMCKFASKPGATKVSDAHSVKIDRRAFARGVEELMTLRPLRDVVSAVLTSHKAVGREVSVDSASSGGREETRNHGGCVTPERSRRTG